MRDFEMYELATYRCRVCGCKNKLYTEILLDNDPWDPCACKCRQDEPKVIGYNTKCCNCGHHMEWIFDTDDEIANINHRTKAGRAFCIQPSYCKHKDCKLYGTCKMNDILHPNPPVNAPKKLHFDELDVKPTMTPKFL